MVAPPGRFSSCDSMNLRKVFVHPNRSSAPCIGFLCRGAAELVLLKF